MFQDSHVYARRRRVSHMRSVYSTVMKELRKNNEGGAPTIRLDDFLSSGLPVSIERVEDVHVCRGEINDGHVIDSSAHMLVLNGICHGGIRLYMRGYVLVVEPRTQEGDRLLAPEMITDDVFPATINDTGAVDPYESMTGHTNVDKNCYHRAILKAELAEIYCQPDLDSLNAIIEQPANDGRFLLEFRRDARRGYGDNGWSITVTVIDGEKDSDKAIV